MVKKTKTQAQNSNQKLNKKTQALGGFPQKLKKVKKITQIWMFFQGGDAHFVISIAKYVQKQKFLYSKNQKGSKII